MKRIIYFIIFLFTISVFPYYMVANTTEIVVIDDEVFDFSMTSKNDLVELVWNNVPEKTATMSIERSFDGKRYTTIYRTNNLASNTYQDDLFSLPVDEVYYRFKFVLRDDTYVYSNSKLISIQNLDHLKPTVYANGGQIVFDFYSSSEGMASAQVFNGTANLVGEDRFEVELGNNNHELNLYGLRRGLYFLRIEMNGKYTTTKFFVR